MLVLVVDDSQAMRLVLRRMLAACGHEVLEAEDGDRALAVLAAADETPDVVLVDLNMPRLGGLELVTLLRSCPAYDGMQVLVVTTESERERVLRALQAGADEYLFKPFTADALQQKMALLDLPSQDVVVL